MKRAKSEVHSITTAHSGHSDDVSARTRSYLISMGIRTACVVGAVVAHGPLRWILVVGAVGLPYVAVVAANAAGRGRAGRGPAPVTPQDNASLTAGRRPPEE